MFPRLAPWLLLAALLPWGSAHGAPLGLDGTWALEMHVVSAASVPVLGDVRSTTVTHGLLEAIPGDGPTWRYSVCDVELTGQSRLMKSTMPPAFVEALPARTVRAARGHDGVHVDLGSVALGFDPDHSAGRVPRTAQDPAVRDHEGDGAPGFTVRVDVPFMPTVEVYLAQASELVLVGTMVGPDRVVGRPVVARLEQHVIGASHSAFGRSPVVRPLNDEGWFQLVRVPAGTGCDDVRDRLPGVAP